MVVITNPVVADIINVVAEHVCRQAGSMITLFYLIRANGASPYRVLSTKITLCGYTLYIGTPVPCLF